ncbi:MAG TPA: hypothetical protein VKI41_06210, partial [Vicinamibacteria bacterium]|nr:hypothetical protein [Vicinamibacteria bacterium]
LDARDRAILFDGVQRRLSHQPSVETRNRKRMRQNLLASHELRLGTPRVCYDVEKADRIVVVRGVGVKVGNRVFIAGKEIEL